MGGRFNRGMRDALPLRIDLDISRRQRAALVLGGLATAGMALAVPLPTGVLPFLLLWIGAVCARAWQHLPPAALVVRLDATLVLLWRNGTAVNATLCNGGYLGAALTTILWKEEGRRRRQTLLVTPDMLCADAFRQLRTHLRYASSGVDQDAPASQACASTSAALSVLDCAPIR
jgi:hypothetical protein